VRRAAPNPCSGGVYSGRDCHCCVRLCIVAREYSILYFVFCFMLFYFRFLFIFFIFIVFIYIYIYIYIYILYIYI
jgi:hypothetical protein